MAKTSCDVFIIGSGQAAGLLVERLPAAGRRVVLAERAQLGGSCVNFGCTPSKSVLASARLAHQARRAADFGLSIPSVTADFAAVMSQARALVQHSVSGLAESFDGPDAPRLVRGHARFVSHDETGAVVAVGEEEYVCQAVIIDTGTRSARPNIEGLDQIETLTSGNWIDRDTLPNRLAIVGGGTIAVEMAQFYRRMGAAEVTVIDQNDQILASEDPDVAEAIRDRLAVEGIIFRLGTRFRCVTRTLDGLKLDCDGGGNSEPVAADEIFLAVGRKPNTDDLGAESVGLKLDDDGFVQVNERLETSVPGVYATGDIRGGPMFTHTAWDDARIVLGNLLGDNGHTTRRVVPYAVFTDPQLGRVGITERAARESGIEYRVGRYDRAHNGLAQENRETFGFVKILIEVETDRLLGAAIVGDEAAELIHMISLAMAAGLTAAAIRDAVITHPTYSEAVQSALL